MLRCKKSRIKWLIEGDLNSAFFHAALRVKNKNKIIDQMSLANGQVLNSADSVHVGVVEFFSEMLTAGVIEWDEFDIKLLSLVVSEQENEALVETPTMEELQAALWSILH